MCIYEHNKQNASENPPKTWVGHNSRSGTKARNTSRSGGDPTAKGRKELHPLLPRNATTCPANIVREVHRDEHHPTRRESPTTRCPFFCFVGHAPTKRDGGMKSPPPAIAVRSCPNHTSSRSVPSLPADDSDTPGHSPNSEYCLGRGIPQTPATAWSVGRTPMTGFDREQKRRKIPTLTYLFPFEQLRFFARYAVGFPCNRCVYFNAGGANWW